MVFDSRILQHLSLFTIYVPLKIQGKWMESPPGNPKLGIRIAIHPHVEMLGAQRFAKWE